MFKSALIQVFILTSAIGAHASLDHGASSVGSLQKKYDPQLASVVDYCGKRLQGLIDSREAQGRNFPATSSGDSVADNTKALQIKLIYLTQCFEEQIGQLSPQDRQDLQQLIQGG